MTTSLQKRIEALIEKWRKHGLRYTRPFGADDRDEFLADLAALIGEEPPADHSACISAVLEEWLHAESHGNAGNGEIPFTREDVEAALQSLAASPRVGAEPPQTKTETWCADRSASEGCSGVGRPSCTAAECFYGVETCPVCKSPKAVGSKCGFVHATRPSAPHEETT